MKIIQVHNFYQQPGGEDQVYAAEYSLLTEHGHRVTQYTVHNKDVAAISAIQNATRAIWNSVTYREVTALIRDETPDLIHAHNTFPIISPSLYYAAAEARIPVVQTLHNYRLLCPAATLFRDGGVCEECVGALIPHHAIVHRCYRHSASASAGVAAMLLVHRIAGTWSTKVHTYVALTNFAKRKLIEGGLPAAKIAVKPNFLAQDPGMGQGNGNYALFAGRLSEEKGVSTLLDAWQRLDSTIPLKIAGDGPLAPMLKQRVTQLRNVEWLGHCSRERTLELLQNAVLLVLPSLWYEGFPMTVLESMACGTPIVASDLGSLSELIQDGVNGFRFVAGDVVSLIDRVQFLWTRRNELLSFRQSSRLCCEQNYAPERNYELLMHIYGQAVEDTQQNSPDLVLYR
ncbi:MAG: glycosyltransferase family 4 protein [Acidobacteriaceae bacterium]|nr:glycosyltransferase family 4 protein [Acidobacteriaceae bacterium]MBV9296069.1 glycosyltransferase family 4 protein [Acidobacteriaceae bacterium]MBV9764614.1 glycosyltransferase family 4 protein [Acidobacteriaceae bacterium]